VPAGGVWRRSILAMVAMLWFASTATGLWVLWAYDNRPGTPAIAVDRWPSESGLARETTRPTLVMLVHPRCTCSRASLGELAEILARAKVHPKTYVLFLRPEGFSEGWEKTDLWRTASALTDVTVVLDDDGTRARQFGAATSGQTFLYDAEGTLRFSGGVTGARAHAGENAGRTAVLALLEQSPPAPLGGRQSVWTRVFGCSLFGSRTAQRSGE
jgi:hypothetical protein